MFFDNIDDLPMIAKKCGTSIFVIPDNNEIKITNSIILCPDTKSVITIEQVRNVIARLNTRQLNDQYILIRPAEKLGEDAANAILKNLEEPGEKIHFVLVTEHPSKLLPTILSRANMYMLSDNFCIDGDIAFSEKTKELAKRMMVAKGAELVDLVEIIVKKKDGVRQYALEVLGAAIEMLYKTYFITKKSIFLEKIPKFLNAYDGVSRNGHVKLQIVSNLC